MANEVEKLNGIALADIEKINGRTEANIEEINGLSFEAAEYGPPAFVQSVDRNYLGAGVEYGITGDITVGSGEGRALVVVTLLRDDDGAPSATGCTFTKSGGSAQAFTQLIVVDSGYTEVSIWGLIAPVTGAGEVKLDFDRTLNQASSAKIIELTGVKQSGGNLGMAAGAAGGANTSATTLSQSIDTTAGQIVIDGMYLVGGTAGTGGAVGSSQTQVGALADRGYGASYKTASGASTTLTWSWDNSSTVAFNIVRIVSDVYS